MNQILIDLVLQEIINDVYSGDVTAIEEMIKHLPVEILRAYLPEDVDLNTNIEIQFKKL